MHPGGAAAEREIDPAQRHRIACERKPRGVIHVCSRPAPLMGDAWQLIWLRERLAPNAACCRRGGALLRTARGRGGYPIRLRRDARQDRGARRLLDGGFGTAEQRWLCAAA